MNNEKEIFSLGVGEESPFPLHEGLSVFFDNSGYTFVIAFPELNKNEIKAFRNNNIKMNFCKVDSQSAFFNLNLEGFFDGEVAFSVLKSGSTVEEMICNENEYCNVFTFVLVEATNKNILALRTIGSSQAFVKSIYDVCKEQTAVGLNDYESNIKSILAKYTSGDLVNNFSVCKYTSGEKVQCL